MGQRRYRNAWEAAALVQADTDKIPLPSGLAASGTQVPTNKQGSQCCSKGSFEANPQMSVCWGQRILHLSVQR